MGRVHRHIRGIRLTRHAGDLQIRVYELSAADGSTINTNACSHSATGTPPDHAGRRADLVRFRTRALSLGSGDLMAIHRSLVGPLEILLDPNATFSRAASEACFQLSISWLRGDPITFVPNRGRSERLCLIS